MQKKLMATLLTITTLMSLGSPSAQAVPMKKIIKSTVQFASGIGLCASLAGALASDNKNQEILMTYGFTKEEALEEILESKQQTLVYDFQIERLQNAQKAYDAYSEDTLDVPIVLLGLGSCGGFWAASKIE